MNLGLQHKVVLVTGASVGIGAATAVEFGADGARVAIGYHRNRDAAEGVAQHVADAGGEGHVVALDLAERPTIDAALADVRDALGPIDVLVNNAVAWPPHPRSDERFESAPPERFLDAIASNLGGTYLISRGVVADMRTKGWGRIVHVSTGLVEDGLPGSAAYVSAKAGLHGLMRVMSRELASDGIFTNVVMPGFTPGEKSLPDGLADMAARAAATRRVTRPEDIAQTVVYLCSAANTHLTGEAIRVDGHFLSPA